MHIQHKFAKLGTDNAPGQEARQGSAQTLLRGGFSLYGCRRDIYRHRINNYYGKDG